MARKRRGSNNRANNLKKGINSTLFPEIIFDILVRLSAEELIQVKRVCRLWFNIITSSDFAAAQLEYWKSNPDIILNYGNHLSNTYSRMNTRTMRDRELRLGNSFKGNVTIMDTLDGLLLFRAIGPRQIIYICNPITKKLKLLLYIPASWDRAPVHYRLVFDAVQKKYKVLGFCYRFPSLCIDSQYCVLTLNGDEEGRRCTRAGFRPPVWRNVDEESLHCSRLEFYPLTIGRILYWVAHKVTNKEAFIQTFNIFEEVFGKTIALPCQPLTWHCGTCRLLEMEDRESLYVAVPNTDSELGIWHLKLREDHGWVKKHNILLDSVVGRPNDLTGFIDYRFQVLYVLDAHDWKLTKLIIQFDKDLFFYSLKNQELTRFSRNLATSIFFPSLISWK